MLDILTKPKTYELRKLQDAMIQFRYARTRLKKYGHTEPEPRQLFETLKVAATSLVEKDKDFSFLFRHYIMKHSAVNGLVSEESVEQLYNMISENARMYVDVGPNAERNEAKMLQQRHHDRNGQYGLSQKRKPQGHYDAESDTAS